MQRDSFLTEKEISLFLLNCVSTQNHSTLSVFYKTYIYHPSVHIVLLVTTAHFSVCFNETKITIIRNLTLNKNNAEGCRLKIALQQLGDAQMGLFLDDNAKLGGIITCRSPTVER